MREWQRKMFERVRLAGSHSNCGVPATAKAPLLPEPQPSSLLPHNSLSELARDKKAGGGRLVTVHFLDDSHHVFPIDKRAKGSDLLDAAYKHLELSEQDYFGLQFAQEYSGDVIRWVDPNKLFKKQWASHNRDGGDAALAASPVLLFRVKFFVNDPSRLQEEYTRYLFYLHLKRDILQGRLQCPLTTAFLLASYTVQAEVGDFSPTEHADGEYLRGMVALVRDQTEDTERRIVELHKLHRGQLPADAEHNYLEHAKRLEMYGIDIHHAMDSDRNELQLGVSANGLLVFQNRVRMNMFSWSKMVKLSFKRKEFFIQLRRELPESYDTLLGFSLKSHRNAKALWKSCVEHHSFFRLQRPHRSPRFLPLSLGSKFYYSGRTELQAVQESKQRSRIAKVFVRSPSKRMNGNATDSQTSTLNHNGNNTTSGSSDAATNGKSGGGGPGASLGNKVTSKQSGSLPRKAWEQQSGDSDGPFIIEQVARAAGYDSPQLSKQHTNGNGQSVHFNAAESGGHGNGQQPSADEGLVNVRLVADEQGRFGFNVKGGADLQLPVLVSRVAPNTPADLSTPRIAEGDQVVVINGRDISQLKHEQIVALIRGSKGELVLTIKPQALVDNSEEEPLYLYVPETGEHHIGSKTSGELFTQSLLLLNDGLASGTLLTQYEQMYRKNPDLAITEARKPANAAKNRYRDISPYDCTRVVLLNAESGDYINGNYVNMEIPSGAGGGQQLVVNRYIATQGPLPDTTTDFWRMVQQESSHLVVMLTTVMERGRVKCHQYWPVAGDDLEMGDGFSVRCMSEQADETGSFVFRELLLKDSKTDESRPITHMQYLAWPDHGVPADPNLFLQFTERVRAARSRRSLLEEIDSSLKRVKLIDDDSLMDICERRSANNEIDSPEDIPTRTSVHQCISSANPPIIVHCSAGIGRTGVLILMDTALALMETREPVYPLDIVQTMRDQRACMVQNVSQYRFVCECICAAYTMIMERGDEEEEESDSGDDDEEKDEDEDGEDDRDYHEERRVESRATTGKKEPLTRKASEENSDGSSISSSLSPPSPK